MALSDVEVGQRVERLRKAKGISRDRLAAFAEVSPNLIKSIEMGRRALTMRTALRIGPVLGVQDLSELYGPTVQHVMEVRPAHEGMPEVRRALTSWPLMVEGNPASPEYLHGAIDTAWRTWHGSRNQRSEVASVLPGLLDQAQRSARLLDGTARRRALVLLSQTYHLAQAYMAWHGERELLWLAVDRGMSTSIDADDPLAIATSRLVRRASTARSRPLRGGSPRSG